jgi:hypothetical protein
MKPTLDEIKSAIANDRLVVKVGKHFFLAQQTRIHESDDGSWIVQMRAGPSQRRGLITNIEDNRYGREFAILP